jgi:thiosulfate dehydrogenase
MSVDVEREPDFIKLIRAVVYLSLVSLILVVATLFALYFSTSSDRFPAKQVPVVLADTSKPPTGMWQAPDSTLIPLTPEGDLIRYGRELIAHTAVYLGPEGKVKQVSNGMNCQNCHLKAGTKIYGNNYAAVASTYPRFRARSGTTETVEKRINDCIERSLNGKPLDANSREMKAMIAYFQWLGQDVEKGVVPEGTGVFNLPLLERAADAVKGKMVYEKHCLVCHGPEGAGVPLKDSVEWKYPPLAGMNSYNVGAGLYRLSRFAGYIKMNMPNGISYENPVLTDEEAWDVAAYINSLPRPVKRFPDDWPDISKKPFDHPFGPYADSFPEEQHKYGPFRPITEARKAKK